LKLRLVALFAVLAIAAPLSPASAGLSDATVGLTLVTDQVNAPIAMAVRTGDPAIYIAEKGGTVQQLIGGTLTEILDISGQVSTDGERGLLGLTFSPAGDELFVNYTDTTGDITIDGYAFAGLPLNPATAYEIISIDHPKSNHNGGNVAFGPDGHLYISTGDGGGVGDDPQNNAQRIDRLLGKMLRIDPTPGGGYDLPPGNPFGNEVWARGLRNPWRFSFDRTTGHLWIADVGASRREEVDVQAASSGGGQNYGWRKMEGTKHIHGRRPPRRHVKPVYEYRHKGGNCSITGGYVYRGGAIPDLVGSYVFADFCVGNLGAFLSTNRKIARGLGLHVDNPSSFGEDAAGELYVLSLSGGAVYRIDPA
jgi:hypothetical protein